VTYKVFIIGAGAAGGSLAAKLTKTGERIVGVYDPIRDHARAVAKATKTDPYWEEPPQTIKKADIAFVAVPDSEVLKAAKEIAGLGLNAPEQTWLHVSGSLSVEVLAPLSQAGSSIGAFHPAIVFPPGRITPIPSGTYFAIDGDDRALIVAEKMADRLGGVAVRVPAAVRPLYHAATVLASNYIVALLWQAGLMLSDAGLKGGDVEKLLTSLALSALNRADKDGIDKSLSGPILRGEADTVRRHLDALKESFEVKEIYRVLGRATVRLTETIGKTDINSVICMKKLLED
jgi:predicted short-subunit dehydrogenase-like oxidoreductase (DUF2520 family)